MTLQWHLDKEVGGETKRVGQLLFAESNIGASSRILREDH